MKIAVIFVHGGDSYSQHDDFLRSLKTQELRNPLGNRSNSWWCDSLCDQLGNTYDVYTPTMPNKANAEFLEWKIWFERHLSLTTDHDQVLLVGWSLGAMFLAKYLSETESNHRHRAVYLLSGPCGTFQDGTGNDCGSFQFDPAQLSKLTEKAKQIIIMHSKDDFIVPYEHALKFEASIPGSELVTFTDRNHFLQPELPELIEHIKRLG